MPVVGDFLGVGNYQYAVWRASIGTWFIYDVPTNTRRQIQWGTLGDVPLEGDFDGDGIADIAVWRPGNGTFYIIPSSTRIAYSVVLGISSDIPTTGSYTYRRMQQLGVKIG